MSGETVAAVTDAWSAFGAIEISAGDRREP